MKISGLGENSQRFWLFALVIWVGNPAITQEYQYTKLKLFPDKDELIVRNVEQDTKGFIWYLSNGEIYRYDGHSSLNLAASLSNGQKIDDTPQRILIDNQDRLWIASIHSLSYIDLKTWELHRIPESKLPPTRVRYVNSIKEIEDGSGRIIIGYHSGHLLVYRDGEVEIIDELYEKGSKEGTPIHIPSIAINKDEVWVGTSIGSVFSVDLEELTLVEYLIPEVENAIEWIIPDKDHLILDVLDVGVFRFYPKKASPLLKVHNPVIQPSVLHSLIRYNEYIIYNEKDRLTLLNETDLSTYAVISPPTIDILDIEIDEKELILATSEGIWIAYPESPGVTSFIPDHEDPNKSARGMYRFEDGGIFYATYGGAGYLEASGEMHEFKNMKEVYAILPLNDSQLLLGCEGDFLVVFDVHTLSFLTVDYTIPPFVENEFAVDFSQYVLSLAEDEAAYYIGTTNGMYLLDKNTNELYPHSYEKTHPTQDFQIRDISIHEGRVLISTHLGLLKYDDGAWQKIFPLEGNLGVYEHAVNTDTIWMATQGLGVVGINRRGTILKSYTKRNGLSDDLVYNLTVVDDLTVAGTSYGLNIIKGGGVRRLTKKDGLNQNEFNHGSTFFSRVTNELYVGGLNGYTLLDTKSKWFYESELPPVYITELHIIDNTTSEITKSYTSPYLPVDQIELEPTQSFVNIHVGNPKSYRSKERIGFKVEEIADSWQELESGQPISLVGLAPASYQLVITNSMDHGKNAVIQLEIEKLPFFYQTWWFLTIVLLGLLGLVGLIYRSRLQKMKKEMALRTRISSDLHDEVGSLLTGISMQAEFIQLNKEGNSSRNYLKTIAKSSKEAIRAMGDIVWSIDARNDNWESLVIKLREYAHYLFDPAGIDFKMQEVGRSPDSFSQQLRHTIYLVVKEALNNISKHAHATCVSIVFNYTAKGVLIVIHDNGKGFKEHKNVAGQGIKNMKERAAKVKAELSIHHLEQGTEIRFFKSIRLKTTRWVGQRIESE